MTDYISRWDAINAIQEHFTEDGFRGYKDGQKMLDRINAIPAADVRENKRGKWDDKKVAFYFKCSECGCCVRAFAGEVFLDYAQEWNFCPNCGADMREEQT